MAERARRRRVAIWYRSRLLCFGGRCVQVFTRRGGIRQTDGVTSASLATRLPSSRCGSELVAFRSTAVTEGMAGWSSRRSTTRPGPSVHHRSRMRADRHCGWHRNLPDRQTAGLRRHMEQSFLTAGLP